MALREESLDRASGGGKTISDGQAEDAFRTILKWIGEDANRDGLIDTPNRMVRAYREYFAGYDEDPHEVLHKTFSEVDGYDEMIVLRGLQGFAGGVLSATAIGAALWWITPFSPWQAAAMALVVTLMGFFGGLVMSAIKRDRGVKDWGQLIEGHGGMLDRLDSVIFAAPVFFHVTRYWWTV